MPLTLLTGLLAAAAASASPAPAPDYTSAGSWACRPGAETRCTEGLDAIAVDADGTRTPAPFVAAADPAIDCFYVYPTVSSEETPYADLQPSPEIIEAIRAQAGPLASTCRLFAPLYRQSTLAGLRRSLAGGQLPDWDLPYQDVRAAWRQYLARDNGGRGVVLVGHSQGTILLQRLIAEEIDGKPAQARLVSAFLPGDPALPVPPGETVGGVFKHIPLCAAASQTGCVYVWSSYAAGDTQPHTFGKDLSATLVAGCDSPAAPGGGTGTLKAFLPRPGMAPASDPPWIKVVGQLSGTCTRDAGGTVMRVSALPGRYADLLGAMLHDAGGRPGWGLHRLDVSLALGNMLDVINAEAAHWPAR